MVPSFGPNTFPANNSALFACETQVDYAIKSLFTPILDKRFSIIEVKQSAEDRETNAIHHELRNTVFASACSNWYIGDFGRNTASWPGLASEFWRETFFPQWSAFNTACGSNFWFLNTVSRWVKNSGWWGRLTVLAVVAYVVAKMGQKQGLQEAGSMAVNRTQQLLRPSGDEIRNFQRVNIVEG
jgi:hypothetical protein